MSNQGFLNTPGGNRSLQKSQSKKITTHRASLAVLGVQHSTNNNVSM